MFLGLVEYYRKFMKGFAKIANPLNVLLRKVEPWNGKPKQEVSFNELKKAIYNAPILQYPDIDKTFILTTDASGETIGAVLAQEGPADEVLVAFAFRQLNRHGKNYAVIDKELLAIIWGVRQFRPYMYGHKFLIYTNHQPLTHLYNCKKLGISDGSWPWMRTTST